MSDKYQLNILMADYPVTHAMHTGEVTSDLMDFNYAPYKVSNHAFKPFVRELAFEAGELAIATFLQAICYGKKLTLLPATISGRLQHNCIVYNYDAKGEITPKDLEGKTVGVRAYTQTTGLWVRGILENQYGVDMDSITWLTFEDAHVEEYKNPSNVIIAEEGKKLDQMVLDGELDAAIGSGFKDERLRTVIKDPKAAGKEWWETNKAVSMNHMAVVTTEFAENHPELCADLVRVLKESKAKANLNADPDMRPYGLEALRPGLELAIKYCYQQKLLPRMMEVDELFHENTRDLG